jgi:hypothetical protein
MKKCLLDLLGLRGLGLMVSCGDGIGATTTPALPRVLTITSAAQPSAMPESRCGTKIGGQVVMALSVRTSLLGLSLVAASGFVSCGGGNTMPSPPAPTGACCT